MAISNFSELKTAVANFLNRDDLTSAIPDFITLAEAQIQRDIRHWKMENRAEGEIAGQYISRPSDWLETIRIHLTNSGTTKLQLLSRDAMADKRMGAENATGKPIYYCHSESQFELYPSPDSQDYVMELLYYQKIPALSETNTTNWLLSEAPDVYLYGALNHSAPYLQEDERLAVWAQLYAAGVTRLNDSSDRAAMSGSGLTMRNKGLG